MAPVRLRPSEFSLFSSISHFGPTNHSEEGFNLRYSQISAGGYEHEAIRLVIRVKNLGTEYLSPV